MTDALAARLAELTARFRARAGEERMVLARALAEDDRATVAERAHKLAGNAGMFGEAELGEAALALEEAAETGAALRESGERLLAMLATL